MMSVKTSRPFVYGHFSRPPADYEALTFLPPGSENLAVEILREFSANEFVGKLYYKSSLGDWTPLDPSKLSQYSSYSWFEMEGSGRWEVLHFRAESDEGGPYVAVALRYAGPQGSFMKALER
jgi:hypothetical protein